MVSVTVSIFIEVNMMGDKISLENYHREVLRNRTTIGQVALCDSTVVN